MKIAKVVYNTGRQWRSSEGGAGKVHDTGEDHVPTNWPDMNQQLPAAVKEHAQKQPINQTMTNPSGAGEAPQLENDRTKSSSMPIRFTTNPAPQQMEMWFGLDLRQAFVLGWAGTNHYPILKPTQAV